MEEVGCGENLQGVRRNASSSSSDSTPARIRLRGQSSSVSSSSFISSRGWAQSTKGRHITNIHKINVINNFGMNREKSAKENMGWLVLRIVVALLIIVWFVAVVSVTSGAVLPPSSDKTNPKGELMDLSHVTTKSKELLAKTENYIRSVDNDAISALKALKIPTHLPQSKASRRPHSIFELSLFGNKSPSDFQLYTPHAPSCSEALDAHEVSFTLVSQLSNDRLWMIQYHCERWGDNPMSIVVFTDRAAADVKSELISMGCSRENLTLQTVKKTTYDPDGTEYPVNLLRNLALSAVKTSHIVYADVDFWPSSDLHSILSNETIKEQLASDSKLAAIIPAFQMERLCREYRDCREANIPKMPRHKGALMWLIGRRAASAFDPTNPGGHGSTKYITWKEQETATFVDLPCIQSNRFEPYLVVRYCSELPPFQEGFTGYGKNKMTWAMLLRRVGYKFSQIGGAFLVHYPHLDSKSREEWNKKPEVLSNKPSKVASKVIEKNADNIDLSQFKRARVDALFLDFKRWLNENVEDESRTPKCKNAQNDDYSLWVHPSEKEEYDEGEDSEEESGEGDGDGENVEEGEGGADNDFHEKEANARKRVEIVEPSSEDEGNADKQDNDEGDSNGGNVGEGENDVDDYLLEEEDDAKKRIENVEHDTENGENFMISKESIE